MGVESILNKRIHPRYVKSKGHDEWMHTSKSIEPFQTFSEKIFDYTLFLRISCSLFDISLLLVFSHYRLQPSLSVSIALSSQNGLSFINVGLLLVFSGNLRTFPIYCSRLYFIFATIYFALLIIVVSFMLDLRRSSNA